MSELVAGSTKVGGVEAGRAGGVELRDECVGVVTSISRLRRAERGWKVRRREAGDVRVEGGIDRDAEAFVDAATAQQRGIEERGRPGGVDLGHEDIAAADAGRLVSPGGGREVG